MEERRIASSRTFAYWQLTRGVESTSIAAWCWYRMGRTFLLLLLSLRKIKDNVSDDDGRRSTTYTSSNPEREIPSVPISKECRSETQLCEMDVVFSLFSTHWCTTIDWIVIVPMIGFSLSLSLSLSLKEKIRRPFFSDDRLSVSTEVDISVSPSIDHHGTSESDERDRDN